MRNGKAAGGLFTWDDYQSLPEDDGLRHEVLGGEHVVSPSPGERHQATQLRLGSALLRAIEEAGRGRVLPAPFDVKLSHLDVVQPDLIAFVGAGRDRLNAKYCDGPPDLAVEILSPSGDRRDRVRKKAIYAANGIREYWIVDPERCVVEQYVLENGAYRFTGKHAEHVALAILTGAVIDLRSVFPDD